jgi:hypothetical protein
MMTNSNPTPSPKRRTRGPRKVPLDEAAVSELVKTFSEGITLGLVAIGSDGKPIIDAETGQPIRKPPNASFLKTAVQFLDKYGSLQRVVQRQAAKEKRRYDVRAALDRIRLRRKVREEIEQEIRKGTFKYTSPGSERHSADDLDGDADGADAKPSTP